MKKTNVLLGPTPEAKRYWELSAFCSIRPSVLGVWKQLISCLFVCSSVLTPVLTPLLTKELSQLLILAPHLLWAGSIIQCWTGCLGPNLSPISVLLLEQVTLLCFCFFLLCVLSLLLPHCTSSMLAELTAFPSCVVPWQQLDSCSIHTCASFRWKQVGKVKFHWQPKHALQGHRALLHLHHFSAVPWEACKVGLGKWLCQEGLRPCWRLRS